jgi:hypothetical protein
MDSRRMGKMLLLLASLLCLVWLVPAAALDTNVRIVRLSYVSGDVQLDRGEGQGFERAIMNMPVPAGSRLLTRGSDALAEVEFEDGSTLRLTPETQVGFPQMSLRDGKKFTSVDLQNGTAYFDVRKQIGEFFVTYDGQQLTVDHPASFRVLGDQDQLKVAVYKGKVDVEGARRVEVRKGETVSMNLTDPSQYNLAKSIAEGSYDDWNRERQRYDNSYSAKSYSGSNGYGGYSSAYSYGLADLAYYGNYFNAPGWGWMWRPYYYGAGWNPFLDGAWVWYPRFGYTWVSSYPWGWMPYRYGAWNFVPGYGWCWMPGRVWTNWVPVTPVNHAPPHWGRPNPPAAPPAKSQPSIVPVGQGLTTIYPPGKPLPGMRTNPRVATNSAVQGNTAGTAVPNKGVGPGSRQRHDQAPPVMRPPSSPAPTHSPPSTPHSQYVPGGRGASAASSEAHMAPAPSSAHSGGGGMSSGGGHWGGGGHSGGGGSGGHSGGGGHR